MVSEELDTAIKVRYAEESSSCCSLSCGGALDKAEVKEGEVFVDLGSGRGMDVLKAARVVKSGKAIGVDFTKEMLEVAETNRKKLKLQNASFLEGTIENLPIEDNSVDVLISNCTINHAKDKAKVYSEIFRVLRPGGRFIVSDVLADQKLPDEVVNDPAAWAGCYGGAIPKDEYFDSIQSTGFTELEVLEFSEPYQKGGVNVRSLTIRSYKNK